MMLALLLLMAIFGFRRLFFCMKFMQQNNYYNGRFFRFAYLEHNLIDTHVFVPLLIAAALTLWIQSPWLLILPAAAMVIQIMLEKNPLRGGIKPLVRTGRVKRIFWTAFLLWCAALGASYLLNSLSVLALMAIGAPLFIMLANLILVPIEKWIQQRYIDEAAARLKKYSPIVIGITGSFGKTSVKNILHHILDSYSSSFTTKRSINTLMGIVRVIREEMNQPYKYFVAELGIGDRGQMAQLARFANPQYGMITAVAAAHLENFKTLDAVAREKFRLSARVAKNGGRTILSAKNIAPEFIQKYASPNDIIFSGNEIENVRQTIDGLSFTFNDDGEKYEIFAPVYGMHMAQNIAMAFVMARTLGVAADNIVLAMRTLKQTEHRLEVRREGNRTIIDDSFNSNLSGFLSALKTGAAIRGENRFILITPGMVELGTMHAEQHQIVGAAANALADIVIAVNPGRIKDFTNQIASEKLVLAENLGAAREWLAVHAMPGDVVLYENDLPDVYIEKIRL